MKTTGVGVPARAGDLHSGGESRLCLVAAGGDRHSGLPPLPSRWTVTLRAARAHSKLSESRMETLRGKWASADFAGLESWKVDQGATLALVGRRLLWRLNGNDRPAVSGGCPESLKPGFGPSPGGGQRAAGTLHATSIAAGCRTAGRHTSARVATRLHVEAFTLPREEAQVDSALSPCSPASRPQPRGKPDAAAWALDHKACVRSLPHRRQALSRTRSRAM